MEERFQIYIDRCSDRERWLKSEAIEIPYNMYYGGSFSKWENGGCAFLDTSKEGKALGKGYLIKKEQFEEVMKQEGYSYRLQVYLGKNYDGVDMYTFTNPAKLKESIPFVDLYLYDFKHLNDETLKEVAGGNGNFLPCL